SQSRSLRPGEPAGAGGGGGGGGAVCPSGDPMASLAGDLGPASSSPRGSGTRVSTTRGSTDAGAPGRRRGCRVVGSSAAELITPATYAVGGTSSAATASSFHRDTASSSGS